MELLLVFIFYIIVGLPYYSIFSDVFRPNHRFLALAYSAFLGFVFFTLLQLLLGFFHIRVAGDDSWPLKLIIFCAPMTVFLFSSARKKLYELLQLKTNFHWSDYVLLLVTTLFFLSLYKCISQHFYVGYDEFRIWLVNAKEIFLSGFLRFDAEVMDDHRLYNSFFALGITNIYDVFGGVYESRGVYITQLCALLYILMLWDMLFSFDWEKRFFILIGALMIVLSFNNTFIKLLFINYIEVQLALFFFVSIYLAYLPRSKASAWLKSLFILFVCFYIIGSSKQAVNNGAHNFLVPILFLFVIYTYLQHKKVIIELIVNWKNYIKWIFYGLAFFVVLTFAHSRYYSNLSNIDKIENTEINSNIIQLNDDKEEDIFNKLLWPFKSLLEGISSFDLNRCAELIKAYYNKFTIVIILMLVLIISTKPTYSSVFTTLSILTLMAFVILGFTIKGKDITNNSFHRYLTHSFFAIPLIFIMSRGIVLQSKKIVFGFINIISLICIGFMYSKGLAEEFIWTNTNHERSLVYSDNFNKVTSASFDAFLIKEVVGPHRVVFIDGTFEDGQNEEIYTQYLLQSNSVGGELKTLNGILNRAILDNVQHDYIVIFDFRDSFADKITLVGDYPESSKIALFKKSINKSYTYIPLNQ